MSLVLKLCGLPHRYESLPGYCLRVADELGWGGLRPLVKLAGLPDSDVLWNPADREIEALSDLFELPAVALGQCVSDGFPPDREDQSWGGWDTRTHARICPICISKTELRREWELRPATECVLHGVQLIDCCSCGAAIRWVRPQLDRCGDCRERFTQVTPESSSTGSLLLSRTLLATYERERWSDSEFHSVLVAFASIADLFKAFHYVSGLLIRLQRREDTRTRHGIKEYRSILDDAATVFVGDWRSNFRNLIQAFEHRPSQLSDPSLDRIFPYLFRSLNADPDARWKDPLREVFGEFVAEHHAQTFVLATRLRRRKQQLKIADQFFTLPEAAAKLGVRRAVAKRVLDDIGETAAIIRRTARQTYRRVSQRQIDLMRSAIDSNPVLYLGHDSSADRKKDDVRRRFLFEIGSDLDRICAEFRAGMDFPRADILAEWPPRSIVAAGWVTDRLGISAAILSELQRSQLIKNARRLRNVERGIEVENYAEFEGILARRVRQESGHLRDAVSLLLAANMGANEVPVSALVGAIVEGDLVAECAETARAGFDRILVSKDDALRFGEEWRRGRMRGACDIAQVARMLSLSDESTVMKMSKAGLFAPRKKRTGGRRAVFSKREIESFLANHISLKEISKRELFGRVSTAGAARPWLERRGVFPICAPDINGVPAVFFRRSEVESLSWRR